MVPVNGLFKFHLTILLVITILMVIFHGWLDRRAASSVQDIHVVNVIHKLRMLNQRMGQDILMLHDSKDIEFRRDQFSAVSKR